MLPLYQAPEELERKYRESAWKFANEQILTTLVEDEKKNLFRKDVFQAAAKLGLTAIAIPKENGGAGHSSRCHYAVIEELARICPAFSVTVGVTNLIQGALTSWGSEDQKKRYLPKLTSGEWLGAFSLSESGSGSDAASLRLAAKKTNGGYLLSGTKMWCTNAGAADLYLVMGRVGQEGTKGITAFLVEASAKGFRVGKQEKKLGLKSSTLAELIFENCFVTETNRIGAEGEGLQVALSQLDQGRIGIGVVGVGIARQALEEYFQNSATREDRFAKYFAELQALRCLVQLGSDLKDAKERTTVVASQIKLLGSDIAMNTSSDVLEALAEKAYVAGGTVQRLFCDAKALQIVEGTNQIQCLVLNRHIERAMKG